MITTALTIVTKGILNNNGIVLPYSGLLILGVEVGPITSLRKQGSGQQLPLGYPKPKDKKKKFYIKVTFQLNDLIYTDIKFINNDIKVSTDDITIDIIDNKPVVKINFLDDFEDIEFPYVT